MRAFILSFSYFPFFQNVGTGASQICQAGETSWKGVVAHPALR